MSAMNSIPTNCFAKHQTGVSLVELMISLTIGLVLLLGITAIIVQQSGTRDELDKSSRQIENGRYAMHLLNDNIEHAGFFGDYSPASGTTYTTPADPCSTASLSVMGWSTTPQVPVPIFGYAGGVGNPTTGTTCNLTNYKATTPILVIRRTSTSTVTPSTATGFSAPVILYFQVSNCSTSTVPFLLETKSTSSFPLLQRDCLTSADLRSYIVDVYYISTCDNCGAGGDSIPTLKRAGIGGASAPSAPVSMVEGIEDMHLEYGLDSNSDGYPDSYTTTPGTADWQNVVAVRVSLLARNNECSTNYTGTKTFTLGETTPKVYDPSVYNSTDNTACNGTNRGYKRHVFTKLVRAINPSGRRAQE
jgi:type IV pilus assembly protein PilW